jgi:hypothetical protein
MAEWSEDHVMTIGSLNLNHGTLWLNWRPGGALRWKVSQLGRSGSDM